ncbi:uncharacterized protein LOC114292255 [Camellia sinensis]|uniref:uncharacterized protein LOC114292255 n=1 Tax=Camellia sinensis TaxID=4442 RepID=UPI001035ED8B|nr:uncharacterized protein LOC114292255 [Camellia sinensis]
MAVVIRYVDKKDQVIERFLGIEYVANTNALSLKQAIENLFSKLGLSIFRLWGQGYDRVSNIQAVAKNHNQIALLFTLVSNVVNVIGASCKRRDIVRKKQAAKAAEALNTGELSSGQCLNQETNLKRAGDTRWGSYYGTLVSLASMFSTVIDVLEMISEDDSNSEQRAEANILLDSIQSFEFVFNLHLMKTILAITSELSQALQKKDQDIVNAMNLVQISKVRLQKMMESGWTSLLDDILPFFEKHEIDVPQIEDIDWKRQSISIGVFDLDLALILPVATATVERVFSAMNIVKNWLRNRTGDEWMNDSLIVYIERAVAKNHNQIALLFILVSNVVNVVGASCKRRDIVREKQAAKVAETLNTGELSSGQGLNQETNLKHAGDTRWGSYYGTLVSLTSMFSTVIDVLEMILEDRSNSEQRVEASILLDSIQSFEFVFNLHLMKTILAITSELSQAKRKIKVLLMP